MKVRKKKGLHVGVILLCLCLVFSALSVPIFADEVPAASSGTPEDSSTLNEEPEELIVSDESPDEPIALNEEPEEPNTLDELPDEAITSNEAPVEPENKSGIVDSGTCGENLTWTLDENGLLTISGTGQMENYGIGSLAPWDESSVVEVNIENGITAIGSDAFAGCYNLRKVSIPESVQQINFRAFLGCENLTSIKIPNSVILVGGWAFEACGLTDITLSSNLTSIGWGMFASCKQLTQFEIPSYITSIESAAFEWCENLTQVKISPNVTNIGDYAFAETGLTSVVIPDSVQEIGDKAFSKCCELASIKFEGDAPKLFSNSFEGVKAIVYYPAENTTWTENLMQDYGGTITWVAYDPDFGSTEEPEQPDDTLSYMVKVENEDAIQITDGLKAAGIETVEQVREKLLTCILQNEGYTAEQTDLFETILQVSKDDGYTWGNVTAANFPESGAVRVTLPYPNGAPRDTPKENYIVYHLFTEDINGHKAGEIEECRVEAIDEGLVVTLHGFSPVMIGWKTVNPSAEPSAEPTVAPTEAPTAAPSATASPTEAPEATDAPTAAPTALPAGHGPQTGDNGISVLWIAGVLVSGGVITTLLVVKRRKMRG